MTEDTIPKTGIREIDDAFSYMALRLMKIEQQLERKADRAGRKVCAADHPRVMRLDGKPSALKQNMGRNMHPSSLHKEKLCRDFFRKRANPEFQVRVLYDYVNNNLPIEYRVNPQVFNLWMRARTYMFESSGKRGTYRWVGQAD